ncbi:MAG: hypothetical protein R2706_07770 [Acidimicrobiales bacterium]
MPSVPIVIDQDVQDRWGLLEPTNDYRKLTHTARFAEHTGPQAIACGIASRLVSVDGVVAIDPLVLGALLEVTGSRHGRRCDRRCGRRRPTTSHYPI